METPAPTSPVQPKFRNTIKIVLSILGALLLFLFGLDLMISSLQHLGRDVVDVIVQATSNPFTGLFIGLLITAMIQSSSTTTALVVALVASGSLTLQTAIPIIMGANVGTTITSTIVSLGFISKRKEFRRAVAAGTYHCFFNLLTVVVLFPLEYYYSFLSSLSSQISNSFHTTSSQPFDEPWHVWSVFDRPVTFLVTNISSGFLLVVLSFGFLFGSILLFRKIISGLMEARSPEAFSRFFFKNQFKSFAWGMVTTAAIRSSTITTSVVVPIVAKKITTLKQAAPFIMGANIGTTITAFIAASNTPIALRIAIAHFLFNLIGVILFFPIPALRRLPIVLANGLGKFTLRYRLAGFVFILLTFFFIPFSLIYFNQDSTETFQLTYQVVKGDSSSYYNVVSRINNRSQTGEWTQFSGTGERTVQTPLQILPVYQKGKSLFIGQDMYLFNKSGFCWDGENRSGRYKACVESVIPKLKVSNISFDSVYVYNLQYSPERENSIHRIYVSAIYKVILRHEILSTFGTIVKKEEIVQFKKK